MRYLALALAPCLLSAQVASEPARIQAFQSTARTVGKGGMVTLRWTATGTDQVRLEPLGLVLPAKGEITHRVTGRMVYWLHVTNSAGGQSAPLVVDVLPEEPAPAAPILLPPPVPVELPKLAELRQAPGLPVASPAVRRAARRHGPRQVWIQFAATRSSRGAARLQRNLQRVAAVESTLQMRTRHSGHGFQLIRSGPFASVQAARLRLQELASAMHALKMKPIIVFGPLQPIAGPTYLADSHQPR